MVVLVTILDDLLAHPGLYIGIDSVAGSDRRGAARIVVTLLPGGSGVTLDYEIFNPATPDRVRGHIDRKCHWFSRVNFLRIENVKKNRRRPYGNIKCFFLGEHRI